MRCRHPITLSSILNKESSYSCALISIFFFQPGCFFSFSIIAGAGNWSPSTVHTISDIRKTTLDRRTAFVPVGLAHMVRGVWVPFSTSSPNAALQTGGEKRGERNTCFTGTAAACYHVWSIRCAISRQCLSRLWEDLGPGTKFIWTEFFRQRKSQWRI